MYSLGFIYVIFCYFNQFIRHRNRIGLSHFLTTIATATNPLQRAESMGTFRLWRDLGYALGAILSGVTADLFGIDMAIIAIGLLTLISSFILQVRMPVTSISIAKI